MNDYSKGPQPQLQPQLDAPGLQKDEPWQVQVDVYLKSVEPLQFQIESCLPQEKHDFGGKEEKYIVFKNNCRPGFRILFQLHDMTDPGGYMFPKDAQAAIWSKIGDECPTEYCEDKVFEPVRVIPPDYTTLVVRFENKERIGDFRYTLNLVKDGAEPLQLDPGGTGDNGSSFA